MTRWMLTLGAVAAIGLWLAQPASADDRHHGKRHGGSSWSVGFNYGGAGGYYSHGYRPSYRPYYVAPRTYYVPQTYS